VAWVLPGTGAAWRTRMVACWLPAVTVTVPSRAAPVFSSAASVIEWVAGSEVTVSQLSALDAAVQPVTPSTFSRAVAGPAARSQTARVRDSPPKSPKAIRTWASSPTASTVTRNRPPALVNWSPGPKTR